MEQKERFELLNDNCIYDNKLKEYVFSPNSSREDYMKTLINMLNEQDKRIKELQGNNNTLKRSKEHFKKVAENVVDLLKKLNKFIGEPQTQELNYYKVIENTENYIEQLKQSQKQLAISEFEKLRDFFLEYHKDKEMGIDWLITKDASDVASYVLDKIQELKGEQK